MDELEKIQHDAKLHRQLASTRRRKAEDLRRQYETYNEIAEEHDRLANVYEERIKQMEGESNATTEATGNFYNTMRNMASKTMNYAAKGECVAFTDLDCLEATKKDK